MRNSTGGTSASAKKSQHNAIKSAEKSSSRKLVQARLPFKIIAPGSPPTDAESTSTGKNETNLEGKSTKSVCYRETTEARKRKLSYESDGDTRDKEEADNISKENVEVLVAASKKKKTVATNCEVEEVISLLDNVEEAATVSDDVNTSVAGTSKAKTNCKNKPKAAVVKETRKGAGPPKTATSNAHKDKRGSAPKLTIKLPFSVDKKSKRRKSKLNSFLANSSTNDESHENISCQDSSDDIEEVASELNPQKRTKLDFDEKKNDAEAATKKTVETITLEDKPGKDDKDKSQAANQNICPKKPETEGITNSQETENNKISPKAKRTTRSQEGRINATTVSSDSEEHREQDTEVVKEQNESILIASDDSDEADVDADVDADDETENTTGKQANVSTDINDVDSKTKQNTNVESLKTSDADKHKPLTPKQKKLMERRQMARLDKERKLLDEKKKKQQEKEDKELAKKRDREEKEDQKRREREEKEDQRRKEREERERKRLAEIEAKNEEKRKKTEAKEEELRKKDDERKRKELEKEEVELKKRKAAQAFTKFFVAKAPSNCQQNIVEDENTGDGIKSFAFRPFQIKGDMKLAPLCRKILTAEAKSSLEYLIGSRSRTKDDVNNQMEDDSEDQDVRKKRSLPKSKLYLQELKSGKIVPGKWRRQSTESKDDVVIVEDELDRVGQEIEEDTPAYVREEMRVKFYKFHDNRRPPYYGTFRKKSSVVSGRKPFVQDKKFFDYEVDSDDEWEEEEPGESLEDGSDDDKEKESDDEDYEVDNEWFVPHGHLSDEELQNEDEFGVGDDNTREAQKAKLQIIQQEFAQEMKKKTEKIKPRLIGCIWADKNGNQPQECPKIIWETLAKRSMLYTDSPAMEEPKVEEPVSPSLPVLENKLKPIAISDEMIKDLIRLVHGNNNSKNFLIMEYMAYVKQTEESIKNGEFCNPSKSAVREKIDSIAEWQAVVATATSVHKNDNATKKKKIKKRLCWVVHSEVLGKMDMSSLHLQNTWEYILKPKKGTKTDEAPEPISEINSITEDKIEDKTKTRTTQKTKFTEEGKATNLQNTPTVCPSEKITPQKRPKADNKIKSPVTSSQPTKEKKRVPLLMSVAHGQQIPTPAKNKLISQFLQKGNKDSKSSVSPKAKPNCPSALVIDDDDVVILD